MVIDDGKNGLKTLYGYVWPGLYTYIYIIIRLLLLSIIYHRNARRHFKTYEEVHFLDDG